MKKKIIKIKVQALDLVNMILINIKMISNLILNFQNLQNIKIIKII